jgi:hypothetical protein
MGLRRDEATLRHVIAASITGAPIERTDYMDALHTTHNLAMTRGQHGFLLDLIRTTLRSQFVDANFPASLDVFHTKCQLLCNLCNFPALAASGFKKALDRLLEQTWMESHSN